MDKTRRINLIFHKNGIEAEEEKKVEFFSINQFITNLNGFGYTTENSYNNFENRMLVGKAGKNIIPLSFEIKFKTYTLYNEFIKNVSWSNHRITLEYIITINDESKSFYKDVFISSVGKTEKEGGYLNCPIICDALSHWYEYDEFLNVYISAASGATIEYENDSDFDCEIEFKVIGSTLTSFSFELESMDKPRSFKTKLCEIKNMLQPTSLSLRYSSKDGNPFIHLYDDQFGFGIQTDYMDYDKYIDFKNENIIKIPKRTKSKMKFKVTVNNGSTHMDLKIRKFYLSV